MIDRPPAHLRFLAFDLRTAPGGAKDNLVAALRALTEQAERMTTADWTIAQDDVALGLRSSGLTITVGLGAAALAACGLDVPAPLADLPTFTGDRIDPARSGGGLSLQICAEDAQVAASVAAALTGQLSDWISPRWSHTGFLPSIAGAVDPSATRRNLMGQLDGTDNPTGALLTNAVWVPTGVGPEWMSGGTYLVCRRIRMLLESWEQLKTPAQDKVIGRFKASGAPLTGTAEHDTPNFQQTGPDGSLMIASNAHVRLTHPINNAGARMLRRGYAFDDGWSAGARNAGLFFQSFQTDPHTVFVPIQLKLASDDALSAFIRHESSAVFAVLPGVRRGGWLGQNLFE